MHQSGILPDHLIRELLEDGSLIQRGSWDEEHEWAIRESSLVVRLGSEYDLVTLDDGDSASGVARKRMKVSDDGITIKPGQTLNLYLKELFDMPSDIMAITVPRGLLPAASVMAAVSYVDPGYKGLFYFPVTNVSNKAIQIPASLRVARVFFLRLADEASVPWRQDKSDNVVQELAAFSSVKTEPEDVSTTSLVERLATLERFARRIRTVAAFFGTLFASSAIVVGVYAFRNWPDETRDRGIVLVLVTGFSAIVAAYVYTFGLPKSDPRRKILLAALWKIAIGAATIISGTLFASLFS